jgi:hypothetical protein
MAAWRRKVAFEALASRGAYHIEKADQWGEFTDSLIGRIEKADQDGNGTMSAADLKAELLAMKLERDAAAKVHEELTFAEMLKRRYNPDPSPETS